MIQPPETVVVDSTRVMCDGSAGIRGTASVRPSALGHPRVWLEIDETGMAECGYCDRRFVLKDGPAAGLHELSAGDINPEKVAD